MTIDQAYQRCQAITSAEARNFSYGIRLLPTGKRQAMSALYAMARRIDDIGDGDQPAPVKLEGLAALHRDVSDLPILAKAADPTTKTDDAVLAALADAARRHHLPLDALHQLIEGCELDVRGVRYRSFEDLLGYCRRVAGTVGRLSLSIYGTDDYNKAEPLADALGVALQLTNILRDIREDRETMARVYLPSEDIERFGAAGDLSGPDDAMAALVAFESVRAEEWYQRGLALLPLLDRRSRACTAAMAGIYHRLLRRIQADPLVVLRARVSLPPMQKAAVAARALTWGTV